MRKIVSGTYWLEDINYKSHITLGASLEFH